MPAEREVQSGAEKDVICLYCDSADVEMIGLFGAFHLASQYYCRACHSPFGRVRWRAEDSATRETAD